LLFEKSKKNKNFSISKKYIVYAKAAKVLKYTYCYVHVGWLSNYPVNIAANYANYGPSKVFPPFGFWALSWL
jgi:hypothetical protein